MSEEFWENVKWVANSTKNTLVVAASQNQDMTDFERENLTFLKNKCERRLRHLEESLASNRGNGSKPGEKSCEDISQQLRNDKEPEKL